MRANILFGRRIQRAEWTPCGGDWTVWHRVAVMEGIYMAHKFYFQMVQLQMGRKIVPAVGKLRNNPPEFSISEGGSFFIAS